MLGSVLARLYPPKALPLWGLWALLLPFLLLTAEGFLLPLYNALFLLSQGETVSLGWAYWAKAFGFLLLGGSVATLLRLKLKTQLYQLWCHANPQPHLYHRPLSVAYRPATASLLRWGIYRSSRLLVPPLFLAGLTLTLIYIELYLFNSLLVAQQSTLPFTFILGLFFTLSFGFITVLIVLKTLQLQAKTLYGSCIAATEPTLPLAAIFSRAERLSSITPPAYLFLSLLALARGFIVTLWAVWLFATYDMTLLLTSPPSHWVTLLLSTLLVVLVDSSYQRFCWAAYYGSLKQFYQQVPFDALNGFQPQASPTASPMPAT